MVSGLYSETAQAVGRFEAGRSSAAFLHGLGGGSAAELTGVLLQNRGYDTEARRAFLEGPAGDALGTSSPSYRFQTQVGGAYDRAFRYIQEEGGDPAATAFADGH